MIKTRSVSCGEIITTNYSNLSHDRYDVWCHMFIGHNSIREEYKCTEITDPISPVVEAIQHCHYVDDYIDSFDSPEGCAEVTHQATQIHKAAGFYLRNLVTYQYVVPN